nr:hypothetical protein KitaXyl93_05650 [Kitasatospora sp. Xyl93]
MFTPELVDAAIAEHGRAEQRRRILPARLVMYFVLGLCLFARESYENARVAGFWRAPETEWNRPTTVSSRCCHARSDAPPKRDAPVRG